jgi:hypothetical protein
MAYAYDFVGRSLIELKRRRSISSVLWDRARGNWSIEGFEGRKR